MKYLPLVLLLMFCGSKQQDNKVLKGSPPRWFIIQNIYGTSDMNRIHYFVEIDKCEYIYQLYHDNLTHKGNCKNH